ncbi:MAG: aldo/keto reductase [Candidatus Doudnabacteria bacterium]|nr:aldo/keto reductase [Candidatus Doudnabacteria bacterium]
MQYKIFGPTGKKVFNVGLGTYGHGEAYGGITKEESLEILHTAAEYITEDVHLLIDTAPRYGNGEVEIWIGEFLKNYKKNNILVATKGGRHIEPRRVNEKDFSPKFLQADLEGSLKRLGQDNVFLYQLHNPSLDIITDGSVFTFLEEMRRQGKIQWYGVSIDTAEEGLAVIDVCRKRRYKGLASLQLIYNILQKHIIDELQRQTNNIDLAIIAREPLLRGFLTDLYDEKVNISKLPPAPKKVIDLYGKDKLFAHVKTVRKFLNEQDITMPQLALQFVLAHPLITTVIPGINKKGYIALDFSLDNNNLSLEQAEQLKKIDD